MRPQAPAARFRASSRKDGEPALVLNCPCSSSRLVQCPVLNFATKEQCMDLVVENNPEHGQRPKVAETDIDGFHFNGFWSFLP